MFWSLIKQIFQNSPPIYHVENLELVLEGVRLSIEQQSIYQQLVHVEQFMMLCCLSRLLTIKTIFENQPHFELKNVIQFSMAIKWFLDHLN